MDVSNFREIVRSSLQIIDLWSQSAENLLMGTALIESNCGHFIRQVNGPALGPFQCEEVTYCDVLRWLSRSNYSRLKKSCLAACYADTAFPFQALTWNFRWAAIIARLHYYRIEEPLPQADDVQGLALYWKKYYNTYEGAGNPERFEVQYRKYINDQARNED